MSSRTQSVGDLVEGDKYDYYPVRLPPGIDGMTASVQLSIQAEWGGWELARLRLFADGTRRVILRRRRHARHLPDPAM